MKYDKDITKIKRVTIYVLQSYCRHDSILLLQAK